jgi:hypothetical protein
MIGLGHRMGIRLDSRTIALAIWNVERAPGPPHYRLLSAAEAGRRLRLTRHQLVVCKISTMSAIDETTDEADIRRAQNRKATDQRRNTARRVRKPGYKPHAASASRTKPWLAAGFTCRRTWERHGKPATEGHGKPATAKFATPPADKPDVASVAKKPAPVERKKERESPESKQAAGEFATTAAVPWDGGPDAAPTSVIAEPIPRSQDSRAEADASPSPTTGSSGSDSAASTSAVPPDRAEAGEFATREFATRAPWDNGDAHKPEAASRPMDKWELRKAAEKERLALMQRMRDAMWAASERGDMATVKRLWDESMRLGHEHQRKEIEESRYWQRQMGWVKEGRQ